MLITILPEIRDCIPKLTADEKSQLERNIRADGCREPLALWVGEEQGTVLLDGHNRLEICERHSIDYTTQEIQEITSISEARIWVIDNQFGRRNLNKFQRAELALKRKEVMAAQARERQWEGGGDRKSEAYKGSVDPKSDQPIGRTLPKLAKIAGVGHDTIHKVQVIKEAVDAGAVAPEVEQELRDGTTSINKVYQKEAKPWKEEKKRKVAEGASKKPIPKLSPKERIAEIRRLAGQGCVKGQIARHMGLTETTVKRLAQQGKIGLHSSITAKPSLDPDRVVGLTVSAAGSLSTGEDLLIAALPDVDQSKIEEWLDTLKEAQAFLRRLTKLLKEKV